MGYIKEISGFSTSTTLPEEIHCDKEYHTYVIVIQNNVLAKVTEANHHYKRRNTIITVKVPSPTDTF
jgi:hypothetical protein